ALGEWGANDFIVKPFSYELLIQRVDAVLRRLQSQDESLFRQVEQLKIDCSFEDALKLIGEWEAENSISFAKWYNLKGECLMQTGNTLEAAEQFERAMEISSIYIKAYKNYATAHQELGNLEKAVEALSRLDAISPMDNARRLTMARLMLRVGQEEDAKEHLDRVLKQAEPGEKEAVLRQVAETYLESGLFQEAESVYMLTLKANPNDIETYNRLGIALRQQGRFEDAERCYLTALKSHPRHPGLYHNFGVLQMARKDYDKARRCFQKALLFNPDSEETRRMIEKADQLEAQKA
ncbi:MAG: tetratricopeptide repeat protein, partial [Acidobacteriota bacterium]